MSSIGKVDRESMQRKMFGDLEMNLQATVRLTSMNPAPYSVNKVDRRAVFTFDAGREIYELVDPDGRRWVMQTYSQTVDPTLNLTDLPGLASRLSLPSGWRYGAYAHNPADRGHHGPGRVRDPRRSREQLFVAVRALTKVHAMMPVGGVSCSRHAPPQAGGGTPGATRESAPSSGRRIRRRARGRVCQCYGGSRSRDRRRGRPGWSPRRTPAGRRSAAGTAGRRLCSP